VITECARESEVVSAVLMGAWPNRCDDVLVAHASQCEICGEVAAVAVVIREASEHDRREAPVPVAGQVWWRAAVRARLEASHASTQPMTWLHGITAALVIGVMLAVAGMAWPSIAGGFDAAKTVGATLLTSEAATAIAGPLRTTLLIALAAGAVLVIAPIAIYLALSDE
jgi:hypothetical protein